MLLNRQHSLSVILLSLALMLSASSGYAQRGAFTKHLNIEDMVSQADTIVRATVIRSVVETHPTLTHLYTVVVTLKVGRVLKGETDKELTFRQLIWDIRDRYDHAGYAPGQELILLLNPNSRFGLTSPVGLGQGRFRISRGPDGSETALNEINNKGLFSKLKPEIVREASRSGPFIRERIRDQAPGPLPAHELEDLVVRLKSTEAK